MATIESGDQAVVEEALSSTLEELDAGTPVKDAGVLCRSLLSALEKHPDIAARVCEVFAALGREAGFRVTAAECLVLPSIVPLLSSDQSDVRLQAMRAVGNLCIDHDTNRETVLASGGCTSLIGQLARCADTASSDSESVKVKSVTCGCVLNLANDNDKLQKEFNSLNILSNLANLLSVSEQDESVVTMGLHAISVLVDGGDASDLTHLPSTVSLLLSRCVRGKIDLTDSVLELMESLVNRNDELKRSVVREGCVDHLLALLETDCEQKASDIMVTLLSDDQCLESLFKTGKVLSHALSCLEGRAPSPERCANAALLLANMARSEENCRVIVEKGAVPQLISLTKMEESKEMMGKLHHSALSALRNLSLPVAHKQLFLQCGVVNAALSLLTTSSLAHVWYKALGILRLLVDGQAPTCSYIVLQSGSIQRVCEVCGATGPAHLQLEGSRLLAAIVKHSHSNDVMCAVVSGGGVKWLCGLLESEHTVMVNEGLVALNLLTALKSDLVYSSLTDDDASLASRLCKPMASPSPEIISNALSLLEAFMSCDHDDLKRSLKSSKELTSLLSELTKHDARDIGPRATKLLSMTN